MLQRGGVCETTLNQQQRCVSVAGYPCFAARWGVRSNVQVALCFIIFPHRTSHNLVTTPVSQKIGRGWKDELDMTWRRSAPIDPHMVPYKPLWGRWTQTGPDGPRWAQMGPYKPNDGFDCKSNSSIVWIPAVLKFQSDDRYANNGRWILVSISDSLMKRFKWHTAVCSSNLPRVSWYIMP